MSETLLLRQPLDETDHAPFANGITGPSQQVVKPR